MRNNVYKFWYIFWYKDMLLPVSGKNMNNVQNFMYNIYDKLWGDDITNSLIWIFIRTGQEMFSENMWNFKMSQLPYFLWSRFLTWDPINGGFVTLQPKFWPLKANIFAMLGQRELILGSFESLFIQLYESEEKESCFVSANCYGSLNIISQGWKMW